MIATGWIFPAIVLRIIPTVLGISGSYSLINNTSVIQASLRLTSRPVLMTMTTRTASLKHQVSEHMLSNSTTSHYSLMQTIQTSRDSTQHSTWTSNVTFQLKQTPLIQATTESGEVKSTKMNQNTETILRSGLSINSMASTMRTFKRSVTASPAAIGNSAFLRKSETQVETRLSTREISLKGGGRSLETAVNSTVVTTKATATEPETVNTATAAAVPTTTSSSTITTTTTTTMTTGAILSSVSTSAVINNKSSLHIKSHSMLMHVTESNAYTFPTEGLNIASLVSKRSQSIPAPSSPPGGLSQTYFGSFQRTRTIVLSFQTKESKKSLFVAPTFSHVSTIQLSLQGTLSSTGHFPTLEGSYNVFSSQHSVKESKAFSHSTTKIGFSTSPYVTPRSERNTSHNKLNTYKTLNMISKPSNLSSVPTTSVEVSLISITKESPSPNAQNKTSSLLSSSASSEIFKTVPSASPVRKYTRDVFKLQSSLSSVSRLNNTIGTSKRQVATLGTTVNSTVIKTKTQAATATQRNTSHNIFDTYTHKTFNVTETFRMPYSSTKTLTSVALSRSSITGMLSPTVQYKTALNQMLSSSMISKPSDVSSVPRPSVRISSYSTAKGLSLPTAKNKTSSLLRSSASSEILKTTTISSEVNDTRTSATVSHNSTVNESSARKVQNKTATIHKIASSKISNASIAFSTVDILRTSVEGSQNGTAILSSSPVVKNKTSIIQAMVSSKIFKATSTSATDDVLITNVEVSLVRNKTSVIDVIRASASSKTSAFFSGTDTIRTSVVVSQHRTILRSSFLMAQNKTLSTPMFAFSEVINGTRTSVANSYSSMITVSSLSMVQSHTSEIHVITFYGVNKTTVVFSEAKYPKSSAVVSLNGTIMSTLPAVHKYTSLTHVHLNPTFVSSNKSTVGPFSEWIPMPNIITISSFFMTRSLLSSSKAPKQNASFASSSLIENASNKLSRTQYITPTKSATSSLIVINPSNTFVTVQTTLPNASFSQSKPLRRSSVRRSSRLKSLEPTILSISFPFEFVASTSDSINFVSTTQRPSHVMSTVLKVKTYTPYYASRVSEDSTSQFLKRVSTFISKEIMLNSTLYTDNTKIPLLTTVSVESSRVLTRISGSSSVINNTSAIHASLLLTTSPVSITTTTKAWLHTRPSFSSTVTSVILVSSHVKSTSGQLVSARVPSTNPVTEYTRDVFISQSSLPTRTLTSVALSRNSNTRMFSHVVQNKTSLLQMLSASMISKPPDLSSVSRTSIGTSLTTTTLGSSTLLAQNKTSSSLSSSSSEVFEPTAIFPEANATRTSVTATHNSTVMESSLPKVQNKTATIQAIASSNIPNATIAFSTVDVLRTSVEVSQNGTVMESSSSIVENKTSIIQAMVSSKIFKTSSTFSTDHVLRTNVEVSQNSTVIRTSSPIVQNKTSMIRITRLSTSSKTLAFFSGVDAMRTSLEVSHNRTTMRSSLSMVQSKTPSTQTLALSEIINATRTSAENSHISTIMVSSVPLVQSKATANHMSSSYRVYKTTVIYSEGYVTRTSVGVSLNRTFKSSLPNAPLTTSLIHLIPSSTDVSLGFKIPRTSTSVLQNSTVTLSSLPIIHNGTSWMYMRPSYKVSETTTVSSELNVPRTSVSVSRNFTKTVLTLPMLQNKTSMVQVIVSSKISKVESSKGLFSSSKALEKNVSFISSSLFENHSNRLPATQYMTPTFHSILQPVSEQISTPKITVVSTTRLLTEVASRHSSEIKSNIFWATKRSTSNIIMNPSRGSVTVQTTLPYGRFSKTKSTVSRGSHLKSTESTVLSMSFPFFATTSNSIIFNPTVQKTSEVVSSPSKDTIFTPHRAITLLSAVVKSSLRSITMLPSINTTKHQEQKQTLTVSNLKRTSTSTSTAHYTYSNIRGSSSDSFSSASRKSRPQSSQMVSTFVSKEMIPSSTLNTDFTHTPLLTPESGHSSRISTSKSSHTMQSLTSLTSFTRKELLGSITFTTTTPRVTLVSTVTEENLSKRNSQTSPSVLQKTESITSRLSTVVSTYKSSSTSEERSIFTTSQTIRSLLSSENTLRSADLLSSQTTLTGVSATRSTKYTLGLSSITTPSQRQSTLASLSTFSKDSRFTSPPSYPLTTSTLSSDIVLTSTLAISPGGRVTMVTPISVKSLYSSETSAVLFDSVSTKRFSFPSKPKSTLNSILTQSSMESRALSSSDSRSGTTLDISTSFTTFMPSPASTVLVSVQTGPPPENPNQFEGNMVLQIPWNSQYQTTYTPEYQALASLITRELSKAFENLEGFLSVQVLRFWKSSVGVDFVVFVRKSVQINESTIERTLIEANNTGALDLPITNLQVTEIKDTTTPSVPTQRVSKSLELWEIILIVAGILVFMLLLIICILAVKLARRSGAFNRSQNYEVSSRYNNYIYSEYTDSVTRSKTNLPVILSMEEIRPRQCVKQDSYEDLSTYNITESKSEESLEHNSCETQLQGSTNSEIRNTNEESRIPASAAAEEGSVSTEAYPAHWNEGYEAVVQL